MLIPLRVVGRRRLPDADDPLGIGIGERLEQHGVDEAEHRCVGADADRQHADGDDREDRIAPQQEQAVAYILAQRFYPADAAAIAVLLADALDAAEVAPRRASCFFGRQTGSKSVAFGQLEVGADFVVELASRGAVSGRGP